jgi:hypothetical protein
MRRSNDPTRADSPSSEAKRRGRAFVGPLHQFPTSHLGVKLQARSTGPDALENHGTVAKGTERGTVRQKSS